MSLGIFGFRDPALDRRVPDAVTNARQFVSSLGAALNDQTYAFTDAQAYNPSGQFAAVGTNGAVAVEGQPVLLSGPTAQGGATLTVLGVTVPIALVAAAAIAGGAYLLLRR